MTAMSSSSSPPPSKIHVQFVVYCDEQPEPHTLPVVPLPRNIDSLKRFVEDNVGLRAKLLSYWSYAHRRYELLRDVRELLQEEGRLPSTTGTSDSPSKARTPFRGHGGHGDSSLSRRSGEKGSGEDVLDLSTSRSGASSGGGGGGGGGGSAARHAPRTYRCQLWLETVLLQLEPLDPRRDKAEFDELCSHVARWLGNKHVGYAVQDAVRIRCPFLTRMFDETRSTRLEGNQDKVQLLFYSNNAWGVRDVLQYGFLLNRGVPKSMTAVVQAQSGTSDISTTTDTRLSIPVPQSVPAAAAAAAAATNAPASPVDDHLDSLAHPFIFTSSMLGPNVKQLPPRTAPHKVLLCEVAPGRRFMTDQSLTGDRAEKSLSSSSLTPGSFSKTPPGYDSVCYMRTRDDKGSSSLRSGDEASAKAEDLAIVQVQVGHSYQALPRYLLTVAPTGGPPPALSSFDTTTTVSATASPVRAPGATAAAAAAREDAEKAEKAALHHPARSSRLKDWWTTSPFHSPRKGVDAAPHPQHGSAVTPLHHPGSYSAPSVALSNTPRSARAGRRPGNSSANDGENNNLNDSRSYLASSTPRRAASAMTPWQPGSGLRRQAGTPYPDYAASQSGYDDASNVNFSGGGLTTPRAHSQPRPQSDAASPTAPVDSRNSNNNNNLSGYRARGRVDYPSANHQTSYGGEAMPQYASQRNSLNAHRLSGSYSAPKYENEDSPLRDVPHHTASPLHTAARASPLRNSGSLGLAPPTPPSPARPDLARNARDGLLYSGLQPHRKSSCSVNRSEGFSASQPPWSLPQLPSHSDDYPYNNNNNDGSGRKSNSSRNHYNGSQRTPDRGSMPRDTHEPSINGQRDSFVSNPLIPAYHPDPMTDLYHTTSSNSTTNHNNAGHVDRGNSLPGPLPPASIMRNSAPSLHPTPSSRRPPQAPPAAFNQFLCTIHPRQLQSLYCTACEELTCPYCASIGAHRDHVVVEATERVSAVHAEVHKLYEELRHWLHEYRRTEEELRAEQASYHARQQRELRTLQQNFQTLKQTLLQTERNMVHTIQRQSCPPPLAEASVVIGKYVQALAPISEALSRYHNSAQDTAAAGATAGGPQQQLLPQGAASGNRGGTRSVPEMLHFMRTAPPLLQRVQESFAHQHQEEERRLRDGITRYHATVEAATGVYDHVDWVGLRRLLEHLGTSRSTRALDSSTTRERSPRHPASSSSPHFAGGSGGSRNGSAPRLRSRPSQQSASPSRVVSFDSTGGNGHIDVRRRLASGGDGSAVGRTSPVQQLSIGEDLASYISHRTPPPPATKRDRLLLRCLEDLQRGHIWAIQDASFYFAPGQRKAVCSTSFRLLGAQWELRIAPLPVSQRGGGARRASGNASVDNNSVPTSSLIAPGVNTGMVATSANTVMPGYAELGLDGAVLAARSPLATQSLPDVEGVEDGDDGGGAARLRGAPEEEWLGLFLFPLKHSLRMDFRVIAFSEVTWAEWQVTGWSTAMAGKGWGLYPFLQRKELMRTDKLARDNIVKICVAPISDLY